MSSLRRRDERGGVLLMVALLMVPLMLLAAFTVDLGIAYAQAQAFSAGADSAALAIVNAKRATLNANPSVSASCASILADDSGQALSIAKRQADANRPYELRATTGQVDVQVQLTCVGPTGAPDPRGTLQARVTVQRDVPTTLGRLAGVDSVNASRTASAGLGVAQSVALPFPLAICKQQADAIMAAATSTPYPVETIDVDKVWTADCSTKAGSGNWGWLNCGGIGTPILADAIDNGCRIDLTLTGSPPTITADGTPGNRINAGPVRSALDRAKGKTFPFPVYDTIAGHGATTRYRVIGFINLQFLDYDKTGSIQVRYVSYSPVGSINPACGLGSGLCTPFNAYVIGLGS